MTVTTFFGTTSGGQIESYGATVYADAYAGANLEELAAQVFSKIGQYVSGGNYSCFESFIDFDTQSIPDTDTVSAVAMVLEPYADNSATDFLIQIRVRDWGTSLTTADWVAGADLSALTLVAQLDTDTNWPVGNDRTMINFGTNFVDNINKTGSTRLILHSERHSLNTTPTGREDVDYKETETAGTTSDPYVSVTHAGAGGGATEPGWFTSRGGWW